MYILFDRAYFQHSCQSNFYANTHLSLSSAIWRMGVFSAFMKNNSYAQNEAFYTSSLMELEDVDKFVKLFYNNILLSYSI